MSTTQLSLRARVSRPARFLIVGAVMAVIAIGDFDPDATVLRTVRNIVGRDVPILATLDLHANATERMAGNANALVSYRTYPHIDGYERSLQAAALVQRHQVVTPPNVGVADEDLRHGASTGPRDHFILAIRLEVDTDFFDVGDAALPKQLLGAHAVGAHRRRVHLDGHRHG